MKNWLFLLFRIPQLIIAQNCEKYEEIMSKLDETNHTSVFGYGHVMEQYLFAQVDCPKKSQELEKKIVVILQKM